MNCCGCGACLESCPTGALSHDDDKVVALDSSQCNHCMLCLDACRYGCISSIGFSLSAESAVKLLLKDKAFYENTGGGVTISGGEPLFQHQFVAAVFRELKSQGVHTALDTSGYAS